MPDHSTTLLTRGGASAVLATAPSPVPSRSHAGAWRSPVLAVLLFGILLYGPWVLTGGLSPRQDALRQSVPWLQFARDEVLSGRLPVWDPARLAGTPHLANIQAGFFYPLNLLSLPLPPQVAVGLGLLGHVVLGGVLLSALARGLGLSRVAAALAGMAYVAGGFATARVYASHVEVLRTMAWAPLLLLAARKLALDASPAWAAVLAVATALSLLAGYPAVTVYSLGAAGILFLASLLEGSRPWRAIALGLSSVPLASFLAAPGLWPLAELAAQTTRSVGLTLDESAIGAVRPADLPTLVWPWYFGASPLGNYWRNPNWFWHETQMASGAALSVLAVVGLATYRRHRVVVILACLGAGSLVLAFGTLTPVYTLLHELLPPLRLFRIPSRFGLVWSLVIPLLAAFGLQALLDRRTRVLHSAVKAALALSSLGLAALGVTAAWQLLGVFGGEETGPASRAAWACVAGAANVLFGAAVALSLRLVAERWGRGRLSRRGLVGGVYAAVLLELVVLGLPSIHRSPESLPGVLDNLGQENVRTLENADSRVALGGPLKAYANLGDLLGFESVTAYDPLLLGRTTTLLRASQGIEDRWGNGSNYIELVRDGGVAFDILGVGYWVEHGIERSSLVRRASPLPRLSVVPRARLVSSPEQSLRAVLTPGFNPLKEVVFEGKAGVLNAAVPARGGASVEILESRPGCLRARVDAPSGGHLLFSESYFPGWVAESAGRKVALMPADHAVMAVGLGPGSHTLTLRFTTPWLRPSLLLCCVGLLGLLVLLLLSRREWQTLARRCVG